ncbi:hypothetical protein FZEAL_2733 [Fusarium zealandicum]|uniref:DUF7708 domain-containing protein n=1 Tax=Fusarium zealandicum TaxID=1053134 RepID=A0A8H4UQW6_9HYPO|nr:hypothetical protein FZEAL_2733 [Fusarium zealandicum]
MNEALLEVYFMASELYLLPRIQSTLAAMYTHIIDFRLRALKWYRKAAGKLFRKIVSAIKELWVLEFDEVLDVLNMRKEGNDSHSHAGSLAHRATFGNATSSLLSQTPSFGKVNLVIREMSK